MTPGRPLLSAADVLDNVFLPPEDRGPEVPSVAGHRSIARRIRATTLAVEALEQRIVQSADPVMGPDYIPDDPAALHARIETLQSNLQTLDQSILLEEQTIKDLEDQRDEAEANVAVAEQDEEPLNADLPGARSAVDSLRSRLTALDQKIADLQAHPESAGSSYSLNWMPQGTSVATVPGTRGKESFASALSDDGRFVARGDRAGRVELMDAKTGNILTTVSLPSSMWDLDFDAAGNRLAAIDNKGNITIVDTTTYSVRRVSLPNDTYFGNIQLQGDEVFAAMQAFSMVRAVNINTGAVRTMRTDGQTNAVAMVGTNAFFTAGTSGPVCLYDLQGNLQAEAPYAGLVLAVAASADGSMMATVAWDGSVSVYDQSLHLLGRATGTGRGYRIAFIPDNKGLVSYDLDGRFFVFNFATMQNGSLGTPTIISTNTAFGPSPSMGVAPDGSAVINIDSGNGLCATALPTSVRTSPADALIQQAQSERPAIVQSLNAATATLQQKEDALQTLINNRTNLQTLATDAINRLSDARTILLGLKNDRNTTAGDIEQLQAKLDALDDYFTSPDEPTDTTDLANSLADLVQTGLESDMERLVALDVDSVFTLSEELSRMFFTLPAWQQNLEARLTLLQDILVTANPTDAILLRERIEQITARIQDIEVLLGDIRTAWIAAGGTLDAEGDIETLHAESTVLYTEELQQSLTALSLGISTLQDDITTLFAEHSVTSLLSVVGDVRTEGKVQRVNLSLSLPGGEAVFSAFAAPGRNVLLTTNADTLHIDGGHGVLDFSESLTRITSVSGRVQGSLPGEAITITAYRGNVDIGSVTPDANGTFSFRNPEGITSLIIRGTSTTLTVSDLSATGDWSSLQYDVNAPSPAFNATLSRLTAPVLPFGNIDTYKNSISLTRITSGPMRGLTNSGAGLWASINPNMYSAIRLMGSDPRFTGLNYVSDDGQVHSYPQDRYEVIGNIVLIYPSGIANQRDVFLQVSGVTAFINNQDTQRDTLLPPLTAPPAVGLAGRGSLGDSSAGWGAPITEWSSSADQTESFMGFFNVQNPGLTPFVLTSVSVHVGPRGTADDPVTATLTGNQTVSPGGACSFHMPILMSGTGYDQYWTITAIDSTGKEIIVSSGDFHKPHAISASSSPRHLAHLAAQGLSAAQSRGLSSDTIAFYTSVLNEFTETGTLANATAIQFTSTSSYAFLEERDTLLNTQGETMRQAFIQQFLASGDDLSTAMQRADYKIRSVLANPALFATIFNVPNFDATNASFERLLVAGATYAEAQTPHTSVLGEDLGEWVGRMGEKMNVMVDYTNLSPFMDALSSQYAGELYASNWTTESATTASPTPRSIDYRSVVTLHQPEKLVLPPATSIFRTFTITQDSMVNISLTHDLGIVLNDHSAQVSIFNANMEKPWSSIKTGMSANTISASFPAGTYYIAVTTDPDTSGGSSYVAPRSTTLNLQIDVEKKSKAMIKGMISLEGNAKAMPVSLSVAEFGANGKRNTAYGTIEGPKNLNPNLPVWVVVHGRHDSENTSKIEELTKNLKDFLEEGGQVVTVDWQKAANSVALEGADWTKPVGLWVANQLKAVGFTDFSKVNLIGYSWGSYASFYLAEALGEVGSITALDSAADGIIVNSTNSTVINFKNFSKTSWSFEASPIDSNARALTADFAIRVDSGGMDIVHPIRAHGFGITAFSELIRQSIFSKNIDPTTIPFFSPLHLQQNTELGAGSQEVNGIQTLIRKNVYNAISLETGAWSEGFEGILYVTPRKTIDPATGKDWWKADMPQKFVYKQVIGDNDVERTIIFPNLHATIS